jgi:outer membrane biosynthesis protein TonB
VRAHRRGLIALLAVAAVVVLGVIGAVIAFVTWDDDATDGSLGAVNDIDTSRPDDPVAHHPVGSAATAPATPPVPARVPHLRSPPGTGGPAEAPPGNSLASDEIEEVARKHQEATQRCYLRSQRGADAILIGDVKKIAVTLTIDRDGNISDLQLSEHGADNLGKCLSNAIRAWKFRQSSGGTYRISLAFASG